MNRRETVRRAIAFERPERVPLWFFNRDRTDGDILSYGLGLAVDGANEWGYRFEDLDDGTMGQVKRPAIAAWEALDGFRFPELRPEERLRGVDEFKAQGEGYYLVGGLGITGFNLYTFLRGFQNALLDFVTEPERTAYLLDRIMDFETEQVRLAGEAGLDGVHFSDDWGSQEALFISPELWRELFRPRYARQFECAHDLGLDVWFHSCGNIAGIIPDMHEIGVDVMNISQPNANDLSAIGNELRGRQCFLIPASYQTDSIQGTPEDIVATVGKMYASLASEDGGFVGYVEEYSCMGMSEDNYQACIEAFRGLG